MNALPFSTLSAARILAATALLIVPATGCGGGASSPLETDPTSRTTQPPAARPIEGEGPGVYHTLQHGQTLYALSRAYEVPVGKLIEANRITDVTSLPTGTLIFIPGANAKIAVGVQPLNTHDGISPGTPRLGWPLHGPITSSYAPRKGRKRRHEGIDIDGHRGDTIVAAAAGKVTTAGKGRGYGKMVVIDHGNGLTTLYGHASKLLVRKGEKVRTGEPIAQVGRTGNARGTHLHFEVRQGGKSINPMPLLRGDSARPAKNRGDGD